jgi:F-type H+-transporting ATPase subunit a
LRKFLTFSMFLKRLKYTIVATFTVFSICFLPSNLYAQSADSQSVKKEEGFRADKVIMEHISDSHEWHFFTINNHPVTIQLPVILYVPKEGFSIFSAANFNDGATSYDGFQLMTEDYIAKYHLDPQKYLNGKIIAVHPDDSPNLDKPVYDISLTRNVVQMMVSAILLILIFSGMAKKYEKNPNKAPSGFQNALEPFVLFIRDDVARPYLGKKADKYMSYLLTVFFFIWINALLGLIPGSANVPGNIAFTGVLAAITFVLIMASSNKHYWVHIFWPPGVPVLVKFILIPVEILGIFTKPFALMIRLFANMLAGHLIIISIISLIFIFGGLIIAAGWGFSIISVAFTIFMYLVEILVGLIQAFIFTNLSALFISQAFEGGGHEEAIV